MRGAVPYRAVIFDLGGVVLGSPLHAIARYEREAGLPERFVGRVVADTTPHGAWSRLERGELDMEAFFDAFEDDCAAAGQRVSARRLFELMAAEARPRPAMLEAIRRIRERGMSAAALTNNWSGPDGQDVDGTQILRPHFDVFVESRLEGMRKPEPRIYELVCRLLSVEPAEAVFLDDIGSNLKPARRLGMTTLKVDDPDAALESLEGILGIPLRAA